MAQYHIWYCAFLFIFNGDMKEQRYLITGFDLKKGVVSFKEKKGGHGFSVYIQNSIHYHALRNYVNFYFPLEIWH